MADFPRSCLAMTVKPPLCCFSGETQQFAIPMISAQWRTVSIVQTRFSSSSVASVGHSFNQLDCNRLEKFLTQVETMRMSLV